MCLFIVGPKFFLSSKAIFNEAAETILACSYCFLGGGCGHIHFIWSKPGLIYF